jgi:hypothetical protein
MTGYKDKTKRRQGDKGKGKNNDEAEVMTAV